MQPDYHPRLRVVLPVPDSATINVPGCTVEEEASIIVEDKMRIRAP